MKSLLLFLYPLILSVFLCNLWPQFRFTFNIVDNSINLLINSRSVFSLLVFSDYLFYVDLNIHMLFNVFCCQKFITFQTHSFVNAPHQLTKFFGDVFNCASLLFCLFVLESAPVLFISMSTLFITTSFSQHPLFNHLLVFYKYIYIYQLEILWNSY